MDQIGRKGTPRALLQNQKYGTHHLICHSPSTLQKDPDLFSYILTSHSDTLFTCLHGFKEDKVLLDCISDFQGTSLQAHRLVLAAASQTPDAFFCSKLKFGLGVDEIAHHMTPIGLGAVLDFAYCGDVPMDLSKEEILEEVLNACRGLEMERLRRRCSSKVLTSSSSEREKSLAVINDMWERGVGCDITIQAESGESYPAHRVVLAAGGDYFRALLCGGLRESSEDVVCLHGVASWIIESILVFIYTGQLKLGWSQIWELTDAMFQFQLQGALSLCMDFLNVRMDESSCLDVLVLAESYGLVQLGQAAEDYTLAHFQCISAGEKFNDVPCSLLDKLLERDSLCVESEIVVFRAVTSWVEDNPTERLPVLPGLLCRVRLPLLSFPELQEALSCSLLYQSPGTTGLLEDLQSLLEGDYKGPHGRPRTTNHALVLVGGDTVDGEFMKRVPSNTLWLAQQFDRGPDLIRSVEWREYAKLPEPPRFRHSICLLNNKLYVLGGRKYYGRMDILKSVLRFDPSTCKWELVPDMLSQRDYFSAVCLGGKIYVLGGNQDDSQYLDAVECYDPEENTWRQAHPMDRAMCGHAAAVLDGKIYISGGCDTNQHYVPFMWHYDPSEGCSSRAHMTVGAGRAGHIMLAMGRGLVVAGGLHQLLTSSEDQLLCEVYDPTRDSWSSIPAMPRPHVSPGATVHDGKLYVVGGYSASTMKAINWLHCYDPMQGCWEALGTMPHPYTDLAACSLLVSDLGDKH